MNNPSKLLNYCKIKNYDEQYRVDIHDDVYFGFPVKGLIDAEQRLMTSSEDPIAYFSMEYGLGTNIYNVFKSHKPVVAANKLSENEVFSNERIPDYMFSLKVDAALDLPIYSGGLGVLAGDTIKTASDMKMPLVAVGILWNKGYFKQRFWFKFGQLPEEMKWDPTSFPGLVPLENKIKIELRDRDIHLRLWKFYVLNREQNYAVPLILLDSNVEENDEQARKLTDRLYKSDDVDGRLLQRLILGMGGMKALEALGYPISLYHLNEGHAAFAFVQRCQTVGADKLDNLKKHFAYTCHTPVPAGHDRFSVSDIERVLNNEDVKIIKKFGLENDETVNLTLLAMNTTRSINAVSQKHGDVMRLQFPDYRSRIKAVTNGVHSPTWISEPIARALNRFSSRIGDFQSDPTCLKKVLELKGDPDFRQAIWGAHQENKKNLSLRLNHWNIRENVLTLCWARRIAAYKRPSLIFQDIQYLKKLSQEIGPIQILYAGKAHPNDSLAFTYINNIMNTIDKLEDGQSALKVLMLENYDMHIAKMLISGVDIWLNNPVPPYEASGTSGMKAIANGVLQMSTLDGWVVEAADKEIGKFFGFQDDGKSFSDSLNLRLDEDSKALYVALEEMLRLYYGSYKNDVFDVNSHWIDMMINCISEAAFFNTHRMVNEYKKLVWNR